METARAVEAGRFAREGRWPREHGRRVIEAWRKSGVTVAAFAAAEGLRADRVRYWRDALRAELRHGRGNQGREYRARPVSLLPVVVRSEPVETKAIGETTGTVGSTRIGPEWLASFVRALFVAEGAK